MAKRVRFACSVSSFVICVCGLMPVGIDLFCEIPIFVVIITDGLFFGSPACVRDTYWLPTSVELLTGFSSVGFFDDRFGTSTGKFVSPSTFAPYSVSLRSNAFIFVFRHDGATTSVSHFG